MALHTSTATVVSLSTPPPVETVGTSPLAAMAEVALADTDMIETPDSNVNLDVIQPVSKRGSFGLRRDWGGNRFKTKGSHPTPI